MKATVSNLLASLLLIGVAGVARADIYPPGPTGTCTDSVTIEEVQNPAAICHPVSPDTVLGVSGIITGFDAKPTGFAFYLQNSGGAPWTGIDVFTHSVNFQPLLGLQLGDSVIVHWAAVGAYQGGDEILSPNNNFGSPDIAMSRIDGGHPLPPFYVGTVTDLQELPTNPNAEQWEGMLVKVRGPLRVARNSTDGGSPLGTSNSFICVDDALGGTDSLFIDGNTLTTIAPPAVGTTVDSVQGIYDQRSRGYRIQLRDGNDLFVPTPPGLVDAYSIADNVIRCVFDRDVEQASAEDINNYSLASFGTINSATLVAPTVVELNITNGLGHGDPEGVTVVGVKAAASGTPITTPETRNFYNGVMTCAELQAPDPTYLAMTPCEDRSRFAGTGNLNSGLRMTVEGVATLIDGTTTYISDEAGGLRSGVAVYAPSTPLTVGHKYLMAGATQEYYNFTEFSGTVYIVDEGPGTIPDPMVQTIAVLSDTSCDATQSVLTGEDYEGALVKLDYVKIVNNYSGTGSRTFRVAGPYPTYSDTMSVDGGDLATFAADSEQVISVRGAELLNFGLYRVLPGSDADIVRHGVNVGVGPDAQSAISFSVFPNPARVQQVSFTLPRSAHVDLGVFDLAGRRVATLAQGDYPAGLHAKSWNGTGAGGARLGAGVYFLRLNVAGEQTRTITSVVLK